MIAADSYGTGTPMLLIHGLGSERRVWKPLVDILYKDYQMWTIDMPGFGESPAIDHPTPQRLAQAIYDWMPEPMHIVGNSLGSWVSLELGLTDKALSVTTLAAAGLWAQPLVPTQARGHRAARRLQPLLPHLMRISPLRNQIFSPLIAHPEQVPQHDLLRMIQAYAGAHDFINVSQLMRAATFDSLEDIDVPTLMLWGDNDKMVTEPQNIPNNITSLTIDDCGHLMMWDQPDIIRQHIIKHIQ